MTKDKKEEYDPIDFNEMDLVLEEYQSYTSQDYDSEAVRVAPVSESTSDEDCGKGSLEVFNKKDGNNEPNNNTTNLSILREPSTSPRNPNVEVKSTGCCTIL